MSYQERRLASAQRKIGALLEQLIKVEAGEFPYADSKLALEDMRGHLQGLEATLNRRPPTSLSISMDMQLCVTINRAISLCTKLLGFILRSTNVRNAFEIQDPLKRIARLAVGNDITLILSSDWDYIPTTYPMNIRFLSRSVFVGMPAQESKYALPFAIAGHEIGHSVWRHHGIRSTLLQDLELAVRTAANSRFSSSLSEADLDGLVDVCNEHAIKQAEEVFCDIFGLAVFGVAYLHSFDYLLGPGGSTRSLDYPSATQRNKFLAQAANEIGVHFDPDMFSNWFDSQPLLNGVADLASVCDDAVCACFPKILAAGVQRSRQAGLSLPREDVISSICRAYRDRRPFCQIASLSEILAAGWQRLHELGGLGSNKKEHETLNELILKSVEISEFQQMALPQC